MQIPGRILTAINCITLLLVSSYALLGAMVAYGVDNDYQASHGLGPIPVSWKLVAGAVALPLAILVLILIPSEILSPLGKVKAATFLTLAPYVAVLILAALALLRA